MNFGTQDDLEAYLQRCRGAKLLQKTRFAVAPGAAVSTIRGFLGEGEALEVSDLVPSENEAPAHLMSRYVHQMRVLELTDEELERNNTSPHARYVVAAMSLSTHRGILLGGTEVNPEDIQDFAEAVRIGLVADRGAKKS